MPNMEQKLNAKTDNWVVSGMVLGLIFGTALGNIGWGISLGLLASGIAQAIADKRQGEPTAGVTFTIVGIGLLTVFAIFIADIASGSAIVTTGIAAAGLLGVFTVAVIHKLSNRAR